MDLCDVLSARRRAIKMSFDELNQKTNVPVSTLKKIFTGVTTNPSLESIRAIAYAMGLTLDDLDGESGVSGLTAEENVLLNNYRNLDAHGKRVVNFIVEAEADRCKEERERCEQRESARQSNVIPFRCSVQAASAGTGMYLGPEEFETLLVVENELTRRASFGVPVSGDSMEPLYRDGDVLVVEAADDLEIGEIGVFTIDGDGYVKKRGENALISLNPAYGPIRLTEGARCNGRVIGVLRPEWIVER